MTPITSIAELLTLSNSQFSIFDVGRKIDKISPTDFDKIENNTLPYPFPVQGHAMLAIAFWQPLTTSPYLWFIKLPIDEQGFIVQAARNHFVAIIVEALGNDLTRDPSQHQAELLKGNPYHFAPAQYKLAALNAILKQLFNQPASVHFEHCQHYLSGQLGWENWHNIGVQGLCDLAARINQQDNGKLLVNALPNIPMQVLEPLSAALENQLLPQSVADVLAQLINSESDNNKRNCYIRTVASSLNNDNVYQSLERILQAKTQVTIDTLVLLVGRCWPIIANNLNTMAFLEHLASHNNQAQFIALFQDAIAIPVLRPTLLTSIRNPERSTALASAVGALFSQVKS